MAELVALTYGKALFEVAQQLNSVDLFLDQINFIKSVFKNEQDFYELYKSPRINKLDKKNLLKKIFKDKISKEVLNFLFILLDKKRPHSFIEISKEFIRLANQYKNIEEGIVYSAVKLSDNQMELLEKRFSEITGKGIKLQAIQDPSLIGGVKVKIGDKVVDASIKNQLKNLKYTVDTIIV